MRSYPFKAVQTHTHPFEPHSTPYWKCNIFAYTCPFKPVPVQMRSKWDQHAFIFSSQPVRECNKMLHFHIFLYLGFGVSIWSLWGWSRGDTCPTLRFNDRSSESEKILWQLLANKPLFKWATTRGPNVPADPCRGGSGAQPWSGQQSPAWGCGARPEWRVKPCGNTSPPLTPASAGVKVCPPRRATSGDDPFRTFRSKIPSTNKDLYWLKFVAPCSLHAWSQQMISINLFFTVCNLRVSPKILGAWPNPPR